MIKSQPWSSKSQPWVKPTHRGAHIKRHPTPMIQNILFYYTRTQSRIPSIPNIPERLRWKDSRNGAARRVRRRPESHISTITNLGSRETRKIILFGNDMAQTVAIGHRNHPDRPERQERPTSPSIFSEEKGLYSRRRPKSIRNETKSCRTS